MQENPMTEEIFRDRRPALERHIQTLLLCVVMGLISWFGLKLTTVSDQQIATTVALENTVDSVKSMNKDLADLRNQLREFYLRSEAERTNNDIYNYLRRHDERLIKLERQASP